MVSSTGEKHREIAVINLSGKLNLVSLGAFKNEVADLFSKGAKKIIVDCRDLGFITGTGLAALLWARSRASALGRKIYFTHISAVVSEVLELTKLSSLLRIEPTTRGLLLKLEKIRKPAKNTRRLPLAATIVRRVG